VFYKLLDSDGEFEAFKTKFYKYFHRLSLYIWKHVCISADVKEVAHVLCFQAAMLESCSSTMHGASLLNWCPLHRARGIRTTTLQSAIKLGIDCMHLE
jgi:hypothetical protein